MDSAGDILQCCWLCSYGDIKASKFGVIISVHAYFCVCLCCMSILFFVFCFLSGFIACVICDWAGVSARIGDWETAMRWGGKTGNRVWVPTEWGSYACRQWTYISGSHLGVLLHMGPSTELDVGEGDEEWHFVDSVIVGGTKRMEESVGGDLP